MYTDKYGSYKENFRTGPCTQTLEEIERDIAEELEIMKNIKTPEDLHNYEMGLFLRQQKHK